ncbi:glutathione transferase GstA [Erwiniaceae bacterium BAC15a-03b]|uniref:Glutathione transferase GstA n=2 Tax=Winslowiella TaxID=2997349 RepID=A0A9J6PJY1_9GAMM|nr:MULTISPECIES: glutathione transferase GstA [Winslowiella]MBP2169358.1 glutathione S-transferase [Winslowiella toletana]MCU5772591.1 glutathione transferase GstA [Winslowiella arboricola]MCU5778625.1 glutathione transferase GstA [Winslowiella arboricola]
MKLYYCPGACSLAPHIVLEEAGLSFTLERVDLKTHRTESGEDFMAINSKGYIPALQLDSGTLLTEGAVISQYLADLKPQAQLIPASGEARYQLLEWMTFISTELHKNMGALFNPAISDDWKAAVTATLTKRINWLSEALGDKNWLNGEGFTIADAYLFTVLGWSGHVGFSLDKWPALQAYRANIAQRPAVIKAMKAEGLI